MVQSFVRSNVPPRKSQPHFGLDHFRPTGNNSKARLLVPMRRARHRIVGSRATPDPLVFADMASRTRIDRLLVERGLFESRAKAQAAIAAGRVTVDDVAVAKPSDEVA